MKDNFLTEYVGNHDGFLTYDKSAELFVPFLVPQDKQEINN